MQWQVFVCALLIISPAIVAAIVILRSKDDRLLKSSDLWNSCWISLNPIWILVFRASVVVIMGSLLIVLVSNSGGFAFYFYTQWTFTLVIIYFAIGTIISVHGCWMLKKLKQGGIEDEEANGFIKREIVENDHSNLTLSTDDAISFQDQTAQEIKNNRAGYWGYTMQIAYQTCAGAVMLTDIVFWCLLVPMRSAIHFKINAITTCMHSLNLVFLLLDTFLNRLPFPWFRMAYFVLWSCIYVTFQWILHACGFTWWPYPFLDLSTPWAPAWYIAMALVHVPCYVFYWLVVKAKDSFFPSWFPNMYVGSC